MPQIPKAFLASHVAEIAAPAFEKGEGQLQIGFGQDGIRQRLYWFSVNWKFAFGALACAGFDALALTL
jgi:hypothetical protein